MCIKALKTYPCVNRCRSSSPRAKICSVLKWAIGKDLSPDEGRLGDLEAWCPLVCVTTIATTHEYWSFRSIFLRYRSARYGVAGATSERRSFFAVTHERLLGPVRRRYAARSIRSQIKIDPIGPKKGSIVVYIVFLPQNAKSI